MTDESIELAAQRNDMARVIALALASQGYRADYSHNAALSLLREIEEQGYTLRLTDEERRSKNDEWGPSR